MSNELNTERRMIEELQAKRQSLELDVSELENEIIEEKETLAAVKLECSEKESSIKSREQKVRDDGYVIATQRDALIAEQAKITKLNKTHSGLISEFNAINMNNQALKEEIIEYKEETKAMLAENTETLLNVKSSEARAESIMTKAKTKEYEFQAESSRLGCVSEALKREENALGIKGKLLSEKQEEANRLYLKNLELKDMAQKEYERAQQISGESLNMRRKLNKKEKEIEGKAQQLIGEKNVLLKLEAKLKKIAEKRSISWEEVTRLEDI